MIVIKPEWVSHADRTQDTRNKKPCIYSVHVHPDGKRLATGSLDGTVKIWNTIPIFDEEAEKDPNCHKLLCTMTMHNGAVLCVRWSNGEGHYLASSSDNDNVIIIWERDSDEKAGSVFGSNEVNHESWKAVKYLRGHESDVQDLAWSKDNQYLASCGVDGFVIVWDGSTFEQVKKIDQHTGFVKGVTWDPAGKYLASQSDDKMVKVWRTSDWGLETDIVSPFINSPGTTFFTRLSWAPDGAHIAAANAVNGIQCIAAVINRDDWNADVSLVGHTLPVEVTSFNPKMFYMKGDSPDDEDKSLATICALGSQDRSVSIWATKFNRPVCVAADIFDNNVYDIAWTPDGKNLFACSMDGTVACLQLAEELQDEAPEDAIYNELSRYGYGRARTQLPETPTQLELEEENAIVAKASASKRIVELMKGNTELQTSSSDVTMTEVEPLPKTNNSMTSSSSASPTITEQKISIAKNGKKRIQPVTLSPSSSSNSVSTHSSTQSRPTNITTAAAAATATATNVRSFGRTDSQIEYDDPIIPSTGIGSSITGNKRKSENDDNELRGNKMNRIRPEWVDAAVAPPMIEKSQVKLGLPKVKSVLQMKARPNDPTVVMECHNAPTQHNQSTLVKTKVVTSKLGTILWVDYLPSAVLLMTGNQYFSAVSCEDGTLHIYSPSGRRMLSPIMLESTPVMLQCSSQWLLCLTATGLLYTWDVLNFKSSLDGVSIGPLLQIAALDSDTLHRAPSIQDIRIQKNGLPILITSLQQAFLYHCDMKVWLRISDAWYIISEFWGSGIRSSSSSSSSNPITDDNTTENPLGWLSSRMSINNTVDPTTKLIMDLAKTDEATTAAITISHIETQLAVAALLESPQEYTDWLMYYAKKLSEENAKEKVEELCRWLLGPPYTPTQFVKWEPTIMGLSKKSLLKQILPVLAQNRQLQRTVTEFKSCI